MHRHPYASVIYYFRVTLGPELKKNTNPAGYYKAEEAAQWLNIKTSTVKQYLRSGKLIGKKQNTIGFREEWRVLGSSIITLRKQMGIDKG